MRNKVKLCFRFFSHPVVMLFSMAIVIVEGAKSAGIFAQFFIHNLLSGNLFAVIGFIGLLLLFTSFMSTPIKNDELTHPLLNCLATAMLVTSVGLFFYWLPWENAYGSFTHLIPLITIFFFATSIICFLAGNISALIDLL